MNELLQKWLDVKNIEKAMKEQREEIEIALYSEFQQHLGDGQKSFDIDGYKLTIKHNFSVKVDQDKAKEKADLFKWKAEMSYSQYKKLNGEADDIVEVSMSKPTFSVTRG